MYSEPYYEQLGYYGNVSWVTLSEQWEQHIHYYIINVFFLARRESPSVDDLFTEFSAYC